MMNPTDTELDWFTLTDAIDVGASVEWNNYRINQHYNLLTPTVFMVFNRKETLSKEDHPPMLKRDPDSGSKLHVALNHGNLEEEIKKGFNPILTILCNNKIDCFKVVLANRYDEFVELGQVGKLFTVYLGDMNQVERERIAKEIDAALIKAQCLLPEKLATECAERKDEPIEGCQFVTLAEPRKLGLTRFHFVGNPPPATSGDSLEDSKDDNTPARKF